MATAGFSKFAGILTAARKPLDESERGESKSWLKAQHSENEDHGITKELTNMNQATECDCAWRAHSSQGREIDFMTQE